MEIDVVRRLVLEVSLHAQQERLDEDLDAAEVEEAIVYGEILESYPDDPRGESCLVLGFAGARPIHVVLGWARERIGSGTIIRVITVYAPRPPRWRDPRTRGKRP